MHCRGQTIISDKKQIFIVDVEKCDGCRDCERVCSQEHFNTDDPSHSCIRIETFEDGGLHVPVFCQACNDSPCVQVCPMNARVKLENGAVVTDEDRCIGCRTCVYICPYGAPVENPQTAKLMTCDRCLRNPAGPRCVQACSEQKALRFVAARHVGRTSARSCAEKLKSAYENPDYRKRHCRQ
jgi:Fe-S-cluster-containing hydrogenase component 2